MRPCARGSQRTSGVPDVAAKATYTGPRRAKRGILINLDGNEEIQAAFRALELGAQKKVMRPALRVAVRIIRAAILPLVPVRTGALRRAIRTGARKYRGARKIGNVVYIDKRRLPDGGITTRKVAVADRTELVMRRRRGRDRRTGRFVATGETYLSTRTVRARSEWFWPNAVEYGYQRGRTRIPARSYMRAGFDASKDRAFAEVGRVVGERLGMVWKDPNTPDAPESDE